MILAAGFMLIRDTKQDMVLKNVGPSGRDTLPLKRDTRLVVDMIGLRKLRIHRRSNS